MGIRRKVAANPDISLYDFFNDFLVESVSRLVASSRVRYARSFKMFTAYLGRDFPLVGLDSRTINRWALKRLNSGVSPEAVNCDLRHIRAAVNRAERWELIERAPRVEMVKTPKRLPRHLTPEQVELLLAGESNPNFRRLWQFLVWTGVRRSEALSLAWCDVHLSDKPHCYVIGKGDRQRVVPLLPPAVDAVGEPGRGSVFDFCTPDSATHHFKFLVRRLGLKARLHDLRHTAFTMMIGQGLPLKLVQDLAGHASITTTMNYAKIFSGDSYDQLFKAFGF